MITIYTTAPEAYDGFSTTVVDENVGTDQRGQTIRKVEIDEADLLWQTGRYRSGLHAADTQDEAEDLFRHGLWTRRLPEQLTGNESK